MSLHAADKKVVDAFLKRQEADGRVVVTDGKRLDRIGMGRGIVARWLADRIAVESVEASRTDQSVIRYLVKRAGKGLVTFGYNRSGHSKSVEFEHGGDAVGRDQYDGWIVARLPWEGNKGVGYVDYSIYQEGGKTKYSVKMVEVEPTYRRSGLASALYREMFRKLKITSRDLEPAFRTEDGMAFRQNMRASASANPGAELTKKIKELTRDFSGAKAKEVGEWLAQTFAFQTSRTPSGAKQAKEKLTSFHWVLMHRLGQTAGANAAEKTRQEIAERWQKEIVPILDVAVAKLTTAGGADIPKELKLGTSTYVNKVGMSGKQLKKFATELEKLWASLKGWRRDALKGGLTIVFAGPQDFRGKVGGKYRSREDQLLVRATPKVLKRTGGTYAAPDYILIHELGHRYEFKHRVSADFDRQHWRTTRYSHAEGEGFAELFALGHFNITKTHGADFGDVLTRFEKAMTGQTTAAALRAAAHALLAGY